MITLKYMLINERIPRLHYYIFTALAFGVGYGLGSESFLKGLLELLSMSLVFIIAILIESILRNRGVFK